MVLSAESACSVAKLQEMPNRLQFCDLGAVLQGIAAFLKGSLRECCGVGDTVSK